MEELLEGLDMAELQKGVMSDPNIRQTVQEVLKNPEALNEFKNFFTGGSKWRKKHKRNRKKRGSGGTHSKSMRSMYTPTPFDKHVGRSLKKFPFVSSSSTTEQGEEMQPMSKDVKTRKRTGDTASEYDHIFPLSSISMLGVKKRRGAMGDLMKDEDFHSLSRIDYLRQEAEDLKKEILEKEKKELSAATPENPSGKKVMYGGKWSLKYKRSINCRKPKGFSQKQYCKRKKRKSRKKRKKSRKKRKRKRKRTRRKRR